jgi:hypothetical protein
MEKPRAGYHQRSAAQEGVKMADLDPNVQREIENLGHYVNGLLDAGQTPAQVVGALVVKGLI